MKLLFKACLPGRPIVKKNTQRIVGHGRSRRRILSSKYRAWEQRAVLDVMAGLPDRLKAKCIDVPVFAKYYFHFENRASEADVSNLCEAPGDLLQKVGVIKDDRQIVALYAQKEFGVPPKTIIELYEAEA